MKTIVRGLAVLLLLGAVPDGSGAQTVADLMRALESGGRWVDIDIQQGRGFVESEPVMTMGMAARGCVRVWKGHSGTFDVRATDVVGGETLEESVGPGESVPFSYRAGPRAQLRVEVEWSEPRDTTLHVWVGIGRESASSGGTCEPDERGAPGAP